MVAATVADKRTAILETSLALLAERGFHDAPMSLIAQRAGVGTGTVYRYFDNKDALINELFLELKRDLLAAMLHGLPAAASFQIQLRHLWRRTFDFCVRHPEAMRFLEQYHNSPFLTPEVEQATAHLYAPLLKAVERATTAGEIKALPFEMLSAFTYDTIVALAKRHLSGALVIDDAAFELAFVTCWDGLRAR